jgi:Uma2 family endonuclease
MIRFSSGVRIPDVSFVAWTSLPNRATLHTTILAVAPDLAVEVLSESNTRKEMARKLNEYFEAGVRLVWYLDPDKRTKQVFTDVNQSSLVNLDGVVDGGDVLPGFTMRLADVFARIEEKPS